MFPVDAPSFSPSPPSSPLCIDSSPSSSPSLEPMILDSESPPPMHLPHPLAASVKATRAPPQREKKNYATPPMTPSSHTISEPPKKKFRTEKHDHEEDGWMDDDFTLSSVSCSYEDNEMAIWDMAITKVVDVGHGAVSLSDSNLTYIPKRIAELRNFVAIPETFEQANASRLLAPAPISGGRLFTRVTTAPASTSGIFWSRSNATDRTRSIADASVGLAREQLQLFLSGNQIRSLPRELFSLHKMTVLILRANQITYLPPEIVCLTNLRELNVSNNKLRYLPSEMFKMRLHQLHLHPNPFIQPPPPPPPPPTPRTISRANSRATISSFERLISRPTHRLPRVVPLVELSFRVLFSHHLFPNLNASPDENTEPPEPNETVLVTRYPLPLDEWDIPQPLKATLNACVPGATDWQAQDMPAAVPPPMDDTGVTGISVCPSPHHTQKSVFVRHAEERFTWENMVAGVNVGGAVPLRWRGCHWGCLNFLDGKVSEDSKGDLGNEEPNVDANGTGNMETSNDETGASDVVQLVQLSLGGFEDFED